MHGYYWPSHGCYKSTVHQSRRDFWAEKFNAKRDRDGLNVTLARNGNWPVLTVWDCVLLGTHAPTRDATATQIHVWLNGIAMHGEIL